jgi:hypothetical protein
VESALWDAVKSSSVPIEIRAYLNRYPAGKFAKEALARLTQLQPPPPVPAIVTAALQADPATAEADQAAVDRRTDEILANLQTGPGPGQLVKAATGAASRLAVANNKTSFSVGDRWRYQVVDRFKGEVVRNYSNSIDSMGAEGELVVNKGGQRWDAQGNMRYSRSADRERTYSDSYLNRPPRLQAGAKTELNFEVDHKFTDGRTQKEQVKGTMQVKAQEIVKTPAGEFRAWRVEIEGFWQIQNTSSRGRWVFTGWYVPELRAYVAYDDESRNANGSINRTDRHELTSFTVRGAENFAQR